MLIQNSSELKNICNRQYRMDFNYNLNSALRKSLADEANEETLIQVITKSGLVV